MSDFFCLVAPKALSSGTRGIFDDLKQGHPPDWYPNCRSQGYSTFEIKQPGESHIRLHGFDLFTTANQIYHLADVHRRAQ